MPFPRTLPVGGGGRGRGRQGCRLDHHVPSLPWLCVTGNCGANPVPITRQIERTGGGCRARGGPPASSRPSLRCGVELRCQALGNLCSRGEITRTHRAHAFLHRLGASAGGLRAARAQRGRGSACADASPASGSGQPRADPSSPNRRRWCCNCSSAQVSTENLSCGKIRPCACGHGGELPLTVLACQGMWKVSRGSTRGASPLCAVRTARTSLMEDTTS